jgi:threonine dehydrogenase-like Zn-dependent dehydrogenase
MLRRRRWLPNRRVLRPRGVLHATGVAPTPPHYQAPDLVFKELTIRGSFIYEQEFDMTIDLLERGSSTSNHSPATSVEATQGPKPSRKCGKPPAWSKCFRAARDERKARTLTEAVIPARVWRCSRPADHS